jgi:hypothetical protein
MDTTAVLPLSPPAAAYPRDLGHPDQLHAHIARAIESIQERAGDPEEKLSEWETIAGIERQQTPVICRPAICRLDPPRV